MNTRIVKCTRTGEHYYTIKDAAVSLGLSYQYLRNQLCNPGDYKHPRVVYVEPDPLARLTKPELIEMIKELRSLSLYPE